MLKASQKSLHRKLLKTQTVTGGPQTGVRAINTHYVYRTDGDLGIDKRREILDTNAWVKNHVGFFLLNREHRYNTLTSNYIKNIKRNLTTLEQDDLVKVIYMVGGKREQFSNGTDFRTLLHHKKEQNMDEITQYLTDLYDLQIQTAKTNKPILAIAHGHAFNSGASWLQAAGFPISTPTSRVAFNDVSYGFVPHGGSSYYLSRLPGELGAFLAVTGLPLTGIDAVKLGLTDDLIHHSKPYDKTVMELMINLDIPVPNGYHLSDRQTLDPWNEKIQLDIKYEDERHSNNIYERFKKRGENLKFHEFNEPKDNRPITTGDANYQYKEMLNTYNETHFGDHMKEGYLENEKSSYHQNYFSYVLESIKAYSGDEYPSNLDTIHNHLQEIDRCFYSTTLEEIIENLKRENTAFTKMVLEQMSKNSTLSMKLALKMVRDGKSMDYKGCFLNEINVGLNKIQDKEFDLGISQVLMKPGKHGTNPQFRKDVSQDEVNSYFEKNKYADAVELDVVEKALLPTRFYYDKYSDQVRLWINESSTPQPEVRDYFEYELQGALREQGIDIRDRAMTIESARDALYKQEFAGRSQKVYDERLNAFLHDDKLKAQYFNEAQAEVQLLKEHPKIFYDRVNEKIHKIFENAYINKLNTIYEKSQEVHNLEKRRMYIRFKKFLFQSRIMTYHHEEFDKTMKQLQTLPFKEIHLTEKWDETYLKKEHPELQRSPMYYLSKAIGKTTLAPVEMAKQYLSNPQMAKQLTHYTLDLKELKKLRRDILENPEKYEKLLNKDNGTFHRPERFEIFDVKEAEWNYWYRVLNDGKTPWDNVHNYQLWMDYKEFVDSLEKQTLGTLKMVVQRLINDFEVEAEVNEIKEFTQEKKESKRDAIKRLAAMMYQTEYQKPEAKKKAKSETKLLANSRPVSEIRRHVNNLLLEDKHMRALIPQDEEGQAANPIINKFRQEILDDLYQLLEFVLLNNEHGSLSKQVLEERLAMITGPKAGDNKGITSLKVLDQYLSDINSEQAIKHAIQLVKPYFMMSVGPRIDEEAYKVQQAFKVPTMFYEYIETFYITQTYPEIFKSQFFEKLQNFHAERDRQKYIDAAFPEHSHQYKIKSYLSMVGKNYESPQGSTIEQQERDLEAQVKSDYNFIKEARNVVEEKELEYQTDIQTFRDHQMKQPINMDSKKAVADLYDNDPQYKYEHFDHEELLSFAHESDKIESIEEYIDQNIDDIIQTMNNSHWSYIIHALFSKYNYDVRRMLRYDFAPEKFINRDFEQEARNIFGGNKNVTFETIADYSGFLSKLFDSASEAFQGKDADQNVEKIHAFIAKQAEVLDDVGQQTLFQQMINDRQHLKMRDSNTLRSELQNFNALQKSLSEQRRLTENIQLLARSAPSEVQKKLQIILDSDSKYLNLKHIEELLIKREYQAAVDPSNLINSKTLISDIKNGSLISDFMQNYQSLPLDVVSIAEARETIANQQQTVVTEQVDKQVQQQILLVLDYAQNSLKFVPHERRQNICLGEFLKRHQFLNAGSSEFSVYADQILQNKIKQTIGEPEDLVNSNIDWEYAGIVTNPAVHEELNEKIQKALKESKGYDSKAAIDKELERISEENAAKYKNEETLVTVINEETGEVIGSEINEYKLEQVMMDATLQAELPPGFFPIRNFYQNELLEKYSGEYVDYTEIEQLVLKYTQLRIKECFMKEGFREKVQSNNGHIYLKVLRESIADELELSQESDIHDLQFQKTALRDDRLFVDAEGRYSATSLNNTEAIGYDNLDQRAENPSQNRNLAQETMFDKMLADYFTNKRSTIKNVNELMQKMSEQFDNQTFSADHRLYTGDKKAKNHDAFPFEGGNKPLSYTHLEQQIFKDDLKEIKAQDFQDMVELDIATQQALQNNKNGLSLRLRQGPPDEMLEIPDYFDQYDVRKPPSKYVDDKLTDLLEEVFELRQKLEKTFSRNDLLAYDRILIKHLTAETLLPRLKHEVDVDQNNLQQLQQSAENSREGNLNMFKQSMKHHNQQDLENKTQKDDDALFKLLAYSAMMEKKRREAIKANPRNDEKIAFDITSFDEYYKQALYQDSKKAPRPINEEDFKSADRVPDQSNLSLGFMTRDERKDAYYRDFEVYKENKKETIERNQLFFVLEQFFAQTTSQKAPLNKAQEAIMDYFKDTENTYFFDRNKIQ